MIEQVKTPKKTMSDQSSIPKIVCLENEITIMHSVYSKRIELRSEHDEILYQKFNYYDTQTRIHISMYPQGIYYIKIDSYVYSVIL